MRFEVDNSLSLANTKVSVHSQVTFKTSQEKKRKDKKHVHYYRPVCRAYLYYLPFARTERLADNDVKN